MYEYSALCEKVIDGDTISVLLNLGFSVFRKERIRLYGINCAETHTINVKEKVFGLEAKNFVRERIEGKNVFIETKKQEKYGRYLGIIHYMNGVNRINLNNELLTSGLAMEYFGEARKPFKEK